MSAPQLVRNCSAALTIDILSDAWSFLVPRWGDRWMDGPPPLILTHKTCGRDFQPLLVCDHCREPITPRDVRYTLSYPPPQDAVDHAPVPA